MKKLNFPVNSVKLLLPLIQHNKARPAQCFRDVGGKYVKFFMLSMSTLLTGTSSDASSPTRKEQPLFSLRQVGMICERLLKEKEDKIREEYDEILTTKLAGAIFKNVWYTIRVLVTTFADVMKLLLLSQSNTMRSSSSHMTS